MSRQVINTLLDAQAEKTVKTKKVEEVEEEVGEEMVEEPAPQEEVVEEFLKLYWKKEA